MQMTFPDKLKPSCLSFGKQRCCLFITDIYGYFIGYIITPVKTDVVWDLLT